MSAGKAFTIQTSYYGLKCYTDIELYLAGRIDWAKLVNKIYESVDKYRKDAMYAALMSADKYLPTDLVVEENLTSATKQDLIDDFFRFHNEMAKLIVITKEAHKQIHSTKK